MYLIVAYDMGEARVAKMHKLMRRYLHWVQNSVFEGELQVSKIERMKTEIAKIMNPGEDSVLLYILRDKRWMDRQSMGLRREPSEQLL